MTHTLTVVLLDGEAYASSLADTLNLPVVSAQVDTFDADVARATGDARYVIGLSAWPWLAHAATHTELSQRFAQYRGVGSWYGLPQLADLLAGVLAPAVNADAHVLFTAPDPGDDASADTLTFLPRLAEQVTRQVNPRSRSIAWQGHSRKPSVIDAIDALVAAHDVSHIVECPVVPGVAGDARLREQAEQRQLGYTAVDLGVASRVGMLATVVNMVADTEWGGVTR